MLDTHCHLDMYSKPLSIARSAAERGTFVIAMTNLPTHFEKERSFAQALKGVRLALGLHPLASEHHGEELKLFEQLFPLTSFIGEVGLDFSRQGLHTKERQLQTFRYVVELVSRSPKVMSLHSRGAEQATLNVLEEFGIRGAIFHWYTGSASVLKGAIAAGHYFSVNPSMSLSKKGQETIATLPPERILTESDGPYAQVRGRPAQPWDVALVEQFLADQWHKSVSEVRAIIWNNFQVLLELLRRR
jgi:TatD DNase family protein